jgi:hypothetical protein
MMTPTRPSFRFPVHARLATLRGAALMLATAALISGFVLHVARGPSPAQLRAAEASTVVRCFVVPAPHGRT